ncbi:MAG: xanthine dehydrogenase family protein subunit M [Actinobacteria bacterium]|nr:xanthine dehydrogenase family protein subunit M [Actinomycetota bacterium]
MKFAPFKYLAPESTDEAVAVLGELGEDAKVLAGGQSLLTLMSLRVAQPEVLVDVGRAGLGGVGSGDALEIGATTTQNEALRDLSVRERAPLMSRALLDVAHHTLRNRGTVGGSVAHADPAAELPAVLVALGGEVVARGPAGTRTIGADDFFISHYTTALEESELLTAIRVPGPAPDAWAFYEVARRHGDFAQVGVAASFSVDRDDRVASARLVLFAVDERPLRIAVAEEALVGRRLDDAEARAEAAERCAEAIEPVGDLHGSPDHRRRIARGAVRRALEGVVRETG